MKQNKICFSGKPYRINDMEEHLQKYENKDVFHKLSFQDFVLTNRSGNNFAMLKNRNIIKCSYFLDDNGFVIVGKKFKLLRSFTDYPADSDIISLYEIKIIEPQSSVVIRAENVFCRGVVIEIDNRIIFSPLLHLI